MADLLRTGRRARSGGARRRASVVTAVAGVALLASGCGVFADEPYVEPGLSTRTGAAPAVAPTTGGPPAVSPTGPVPGTPSATGGAAGARTKGPTAGTDDDPASVTVQDGWRLTFHDEFEGKAGAAPSRKRWAFQTGAGGWGHGELQRYTDSRSNAALDGDGNLVVTARQESVRGAQYTSARLTTEGLFRQRYGWFEARMKLPQGKGIWPAFWVNGECSQGWPYCGEIDVMESVGANPTVVHGRVHGPGPHRGRGIGGDWRQPQRLDQGFHVYAVDWRADGITFYFDGHEYARVDATKLPEGDVWSAKHPASLLLNIAVGGAWPGPPDATTTFPQKLTVDWVRVYARG